MGNEQIAAQLVKVPLLSRCSAKGAHDQRPRGNEASHPSGTVLTREGVSGIGLFLIIEGTARVSIGGKRNRKRNGADFCLCRGDITWLRPRHWQLVGEGGLI